MHLTGKHINYYYICHRKLWLFDSGLSFQQEHENVQDGTLLHLTAYPQRARRFREIQLGGIRIDFYDPVDRVVHEIKRSPKMEEASVAQLKYYLRVLERHGVVGPTGVLEYPKLRRTQEVVLTEADRAAIEAWEAGVAEVVAHPQCPPVINKPFCKQCAYYGSCLESQRNHLSLRAREAIAPEQNRLDDPRASRAGAIASQARNDRRFFDFLNRFMISATWVSSL